VQLYRDSFTLDSPYIANRLDTAQTFLTPPRNSRIAPGNIQDRFPGLSLLSAEIPSPSESPIFQHHDFFTQDPSPLASKTPVLPVNDPPSPRFSSASEDPPSDQHFPFNRYVEAHEEEAVDNIEDAWPLGGTFTEAMLLSSEVSNQRFYVLHKWLQEMSDNPQEYDRG